MKLVSKYLCPYCERVELGLQVRKIPADAISIDFPAGAIFPADLVAINPNQTFPTLLTSASSGFAESMIILEYLDSLQAPGRKLFGDTAEEVARTKFTIELIAPSVSEALREGIAKYGLSADTQPTFVKVKAAFEKLSSFLECFQGQYLGGNEWNAADLHVIPFVVKYAAIAAKDTRYPMPSKESLAGKYFENIVTHPLVKNHLPTSAEIVEHAAGHNKNKGTNVERMKGLGRELVEDVGQRVKELNQLFPNKNKIEWFLNHNEKGQFIEAQFPLTGLPHALNTLKLINEVQEKTNHHCNFFLHNFDFIKIELCTHEPKYGVTQLDLAFAHIITEKLI